MILKNKKGGGTPPKQGEYSHIVGPWLCKPVRLFAAVLHFVCASAGTWPVV